MISTDLLNNIQSEKFSGYPLNINLVPMAFCLSHSGWRQTCSVSKKQHPITARLIKHVKKFKSHNINLFYGKKYELVVALC